MSDTTNSGRQSNGQFTNSPLNRGKPPGARHRKAEMAKSMLEAVQASGSEAVRQLRLKLTDGDWVAIKYVLDYSLPRNGRTIELGSSDPNALLDAIAEGAVSPDEAARLSQAIKTTIEAAEIKDLTHKVEELELLVSSLRK